MIRFVSINSLPFLLLFLLLFQKASAQKPEVIASVENVGKIEIIQSVPGQDLFVAGDQKGFLTVWSFSDLKQVKLIKAHTARVSSITFNSSGTRMITASTNGRIKTWDTKTWKLIDSFDPKVNGRTTFAVYHPDGKKIYFDFNESLYVISSNLKQSIQKLYTDVTYLTCGIISPDQTLLVFGGDKSIKILDLHTDRVIKEIGYCSSYVNELTFTSPTQLVSWCQDGTLNFWDIKKQGLLNVRPIKSIRSGIRNSWTRLYSYDNGKHIISGNGGNKVLLWDATKGTLLHTIAAHSDTVRAYAVSSDPKFFITGGFDGVLKKWEIKDEKKEVEKKDTMQIASTPFPVPTIPAEINERKVERIKTFEIPTMVLNIEVWDDNIDGDIISINWNGRWILKNYEVKKERKTLQLLLDKNVENALILYAENLGSSPPNTARVSFMLDGKETVIQVTSDTKTCGSVGFKFRR